MDLRDLNFGVEVECVKRTRERVARAVQSVVGGTVRHVGTPVCYDPHEVTDEHGRVWKVVSDGSLTNVPSHLRAEVVSPVLTYQDIPVLQEVIRSVRRAGSVVDDRCGLHIHISADAFDGRTLGNLAKIVYKQEPLILAALGVSENRLQRYTRPVSQDFIAKIERQRPKTKDEMNRIWYGYHNRQPQRYDATRYSSVNFHSIWLRGSFEIRWFQGTLHAGKIKAYIQFCLAIAAKALNGRAASSRKREYNLKSAKYDFRVWLLRLGLVGDEFKTARKYLLASLPGDSAFKHGRPKREEKKGWNAAKPDGAVGEGERPGDPVLVSGGEQPAMSHAAATPGGEA